MKQYNKFLLYTKVNYFKIYVDFLVLLYKVFSKYRNLLDKIENDRQLITNFWSHEMAKKGIVVSDFFMFT